MEKIGVLYVGSFKKGEEELIRGGMTWRRIRDLGRVDDLSSCSHWILRADRLSLEDYVLFFRLARESGAALLSSPLAYAIIGSLRAGGVAVGTSGPGMVAVSARSGASGLRDLAVKRGLAFPLFVRSEVASAAKYVGVEGCLVGENNAGEFERVVGNLSAHLSGFSELAAKEVRAIGKLGRTTVALEYRAFGWDGRLIGFDHNRAGVLPAPAPSIERFVDDVFGSLATAGADGLHVVDVALSAVDGMPFVVEWKDLSSASLSVARTSLAMIASGVAEAVAR